MFFGADSPVRPTFRTWVLGAAVLLGVTRGAFGTCPDRPIRIDSARFTLAADDRPPAPDAFGDPISLPDPWRSRRPEAGGFAWYRFTMPETADGPGQCGILLPDVNMNAAVYVNGQWIGDGGSFTEPVAHNFNRPLYFPFPGSLLGGGDRIDVLLYAYAHHFGRLAPIVVGPHDRLLPRYERAYFRQITLAQIGTALALTAVVFVGTIWFGSGFQPLYGYFLATTSAWAVNSLNYWVSALPMSHWAWDRLVNGALDQFAVFLAFFFHRLVRVGRPGVERALIAFGVVAALAAVLTPRPHFATAMAGTHGIITAIGAYVTALAWFRRRSLTVAEAFVYCGAWLVQLGFSLHDLGIQFGLWRGVGYTLPYTVSCMMLAFGSTLTISFARALREARALNQTLEERVREREEALEHQFQRTRELERRDILSRERQRLMREMHDGLGGKLMTSLALVEAHPNADTDVAAALRDSIDELRLVIFSLDPGLTDVTALLAALRERLEPALERQGIRFRWRVGDAPTPSHFGPEQLLSVLRIVQEAITNAVRHAAPSVIEVGTTVDAGELVVTVRDDGRGLPDAVRRGRGLFNMERRATELAGRLGIVSDGGTTITLRLPLS